MSSGLETVFAAGSKQRGVVSKPLPRKIEFQNPNDDCSCRCPCCTAGSTHFSRRRTDFSPVYLANEKAGASGHISPQQQQDVEGCDMAEAMAAMGLAIIAMKRKNACTRRIAEIVLPTLSKKQVSRESTERILAATQWSCAQKLFSSRTYPMWPIEAFLLLVTMLSSLLLGFAEAISQVVWLLLLRQLRVRCTKAAL